MSDKKPWERDWRAGADSVSVFIGDSEQMAGVGTSPAHTRLMAAAPDLVRALLAVEWLLDDDKLYSGCPACGGTKPGCSEWPNIEGHRSDCILDAALRKAGVR